tara:strand:+ start:715 stop:2142 length:1428 start_codon:yes stop_codon:yes gene_type:complete
MEVNTKGRIYFDAIYGFIELTPVEKAIIHSPYYQRLRWIKQLGFSCYVFPGAEHSRFGHSIGAMHNCHHILSSIGFAVPYSELTNYSSLSPEAKYHQELRLAALMHDLGTFPFSHTTEMSYIDFSETKNKPGGKNLKDDHENLGSFVIKNTLEPGGITSIIKEFGLDPQVISDLVKGVHPSILANQILHSEIDCDRMDYLLRDAHYTGLKYGAYDRDYLLHHFHAARVNGHNILTIKSNALHCVEDFLISRYAWYSQVIRSPRGAKYDAIAEKVCFYLLEKKLIYRYSELLEMIGSEPISFYGFNDLYFMRVLQENFLKGSFDKDPDIKDMAETLLLQKTAHSIDTVDLTQKLLDQDDQNLCQKVVKRAENKVAEIKEVLSKHGKKEDWLITDLPKKDIVFVKSKNSIVKNISSSNILLERDPAKICFENGEIKLLAQVENSVISKLQRQKNYIPNVFCSSGAWSILKNSGVLDS